MLNRGQSSGGQSQVQDWQAHVDGTCRIIRMRGRGRHEAGHGLALYDGVRMTAIIQGMARRKPNAFTLLNWTPPRTSIRDDLFELAALLPGILQQMDMLGDEMLQIQDNFMASQQLQHGQELVQQCIDIGVHLREWESNAIELCRIRREELPENDDDSDQSTPLRLINVCKRHGDGFFFICTQYWAISIKVYSSTRLFHRQLSSFSQTTAQLSPRPLPDWMNPEPHALNIAHMTSHFFRAEAGLWSAQSAIFPVGHALFYFSVTGRRNLPTFKMMTEAFGQSKNGAVMRDFLNNVVGHECLDHYPPFVLALGVLPAAKIRSYRSERPAETTVHIDGSPLKRLNDHIRPIEKNKHEMDPIAKYAASKAKFIGEVGYRTLPKDAAATNSEAEGMGLD
ncbi:hypothetical protein LTR27_000439 [Elasticomyces elasticus]|nr:hypothetical protein LTR27_000439 [Elasticomyces elasticus]